MLAVDTETTGLDLFHGCRPFYVSTWDGSKKVKSWEWPVDPKTRIPAIPDRERRQLKDYLHRHLQDGLIFHNAKYDVRALSVIGAIDTTIPGFWDNVQDTVVASHILASRASHKLKDLALLHLDMADTDEQDMKEAIKHARRIGKSLGWRVAASGDPHFPAQINAPKAGWGVMDMWLPVAVCRYAETQHPDASADATYYWGELAQSDHPWRHLTGTYGDEDAMRTLCLWQMMQPVLEDGVVFEDLVSDDGGWLVDEFGDEVRRNVSMWSLYLHRRKMLQVTYDMETRGITLRTKTLDRGKQQLEAAKAKAQSVCHSICPATINLGSPQQLQDALFDQLDCQPIKETKTGYSTNRDVLEELHLRSDPESETYEYLTNLMAYRDATGALKQVDSYRRYSLPYLSGDSLDCPPDVLQDWLILHPSYNPTGTGTTRLASANPNAQNIGKQKHFSLRQLFGPAPGRVWYAIDYSNIEMRIFAYCSGDRSLIDAFERGESVHLIFSKILHPKEYAECERKGLSFKDVYKSTLYQWVKNGNFSLIYGAGQRKADLTYRVSGAHKLIRKHLPLIDQFMSEKYQEGKSTGQVVTLGGYPLEVPQDGPHKSVNYFVQGSAGWCMVLALGRVHRYLEQYPDHHMIMTIHDELVFDFPEHPRNRTIIRDICHIMEMSGEDINIPTPVEADRITTNWAEEEPISFARSIIPKGLREMVA